MSPAEHRCLTVMYVLAGGRAGVEVDMKAALILGQAALDMDEPTFLASWGAVARQIKERKDAES